MQKTIPLILIVFMAVIILGFSTQSGDTSNGLSRGISKKIETFLTEHQSYGYDAEEINFVIRKLAHFTEYLVFSVLLVMGLHNLMRRLLPSILITGILGVSLALIDESWQKVPMGRSSSLFDVMIDGSGVVVGLMVYLLLVMFKETEIKKRKMKKREIKKSF